MLGHSETTPSKGKMHQIEKKIAHPFVGLANIYRRKGSSDTDTDVQ